MSMPSEWQQPEPRVGRGARVMSVVLAAVLLAGCTATRYPDAAPRSAGARPERPRLVLLVTVDQLRGDLPTRYRDRLGSGGFRYLLDRGIHYTNAHYRHANTETAVGHATLATGAHPSGHGVIANDWIDRRTGAFVYNAEDARHHRIGQAPKLHEGVSPRNLMASTIGDELIVDTARRSRVYSVSVKDRGAILPGGHAGKAFWYSKGTGEFVTSTYYYDAYPEWVRDWNAARPAERFTGAEWELLHDQSTYLAGHMDDRPYESNLPVLGRTFPHGIGAGDDPHRFLRIAFTPFGDELVLDFVKTLLEREDLGRPGTTDLLAVSFSSTDYIGHLFGPSSLESEDNLLRLDAVLANLFAAVDAQVGLEDTLIVLSADHGAPEAPEYITSLGMEAGRFPFDYFRTPGPLTEALERRTGRADLIADHSHPYLYLNPDAVRATGLDHAKAEHIVAEEVLKVPGIAYAVTRGDVLRGLAGDDPIQRRISRNFHPVRSGDIHLVAEPYWFLHSTDEATRMGIPAIPAIHGSPWAYDTHVPIIVAGHGLPASAVARRVSPIDVAATLAAYLGTKPPSACVGEPLAEVLQARAFPQR